MKNIFCRGKAFQDLSPRIGLSNGRSIGKILKKMRIWVYKNECILGYIIAYLH